MTSRWAALVMVLALGVFVPRLASPQGGGSAQPGGSGQRGTGLVLGQNYPNPFGPETRIPFMVGDPPSCTETGRKYKVRLEIYNLLAQLVAVPRLQNGTNLLAGGQPIEGVELTCGTYTAYWNGTYLSTPQQVASGVYLYRLDVDGQVVVKKMIVVK
jgi:hypothetical protein